MCIDDDEDGEIKLLTTILVLNVFLVQGFEKGILRKPLRVRVLRNTLTGS